MPTDLRAEAAEADTPAAILAVVARATWAKEHEGAECPPDRVPTIDTLRNWLPEFLHHSPNHALNLVFTLSFHHTVESTTPAKDATVKNAFTAAGVMLDHPALPQAQRWFTADFIEWLHRLWLNQAPPQRHPLAHLVDAWQRSPVPVVAVADYDRPLILSRQFATVRDDTEGYYLARFKTAAHRSGGQLLLGFEHPEMDGPTLPANVWNMQLAEAEKRGPGLPAALRIFLASIVHVPLSARASSDPFTPPVMLMGPDGRPWTLRRFVNLIYTGRTRPGEYWPVLWGARDVLHAVEMTYQWNGRIWSRPLLRLDWPQSMTGGYATSMLDEPWPVSVHPPPGDGNGAPVNWHRLRQYMTRDAAAARALVNLAYRWHIEGKRLMPAPGKAYWLQRRDPKLYDRITDRLAEQLCFPPGTGRARRRDRIADARAALDRLVKEGAAVSVDDRLLPPLPSGAAERDGNRAERDGNRAERDGNRAPPPDSTA